MNDNVNNTPPGEPWYKPLNLDAESVGYLERRGLQTKTAPEAAVAIMKSHVEAERLLGAGVENLVRMPRADQPAEVKAFWEKIGTPKDAKEYGLDAVKRANGQPLAPAWQDALKNAFGAAFITKDAAARVTADIVKQFDALDTATAAENTAKLQTEHQALDAAWGNAKDANMFVAKQTAAALGITKEQVDGLEKVMGYKGIMEALLTIGKKTGEAKFVENNGGGGPGGSMTKEQAHARKAELMRDEAWKKRYLASGHEEAKEMLALNTIITGTK